MNIQELINAIRELKREPMTGQEIIMLKKEIYSLIHLQKRAFEIVEAIRVDSVSVDLDTALDLARAEEAIRDSGFKVDIIRVLNNPIDKSPEGMQAFKRAIISEYGGVSDEV